MGLLRLVNRYRQFGTHEFQGCILSWGCLGTELLFILWIVSPRLSLSTFRQLVYGGAFAETTGTTSCLHLEKECNPALAPPRGSRRVIVRTPSISRHKTTLP
ncbi:hypothetical protein HZ326_26964 [Fusarium oxysporum f. sp. albedinis]|nr:hypothetical protein HZ326_26964 [Fusarium oxysporum f. sp. albedinis]